MRSRTRWCHIIDLAALNVFTPYRAKRKMHLFPLYEKVLIKKKKSNNNNTHTHTYDERKDTTKEKEEKKRENTSIPYEKKKSNARKMYKFDLCNTLFLSKIVDI